MTASHTKNGRWASSNYALNFPKKSRFLFQMDVFKQHIFKNNILIRKLIKPNYEKFFSLPLSGAGICLI